MIGKINARTNTVINNNIIEHVNNFNYLEYAIAVSNNTDLEIKMNRFNQFCSTIRRTLNNKTRTETQIKFYKVMVVPTLTYGSEIWTITRNGKQNLKLRQ
jgi:hypothetical protein